jgi:hypothetical protein
VRIGTWNLEGRWSQDHAHLLRDADCDVWLLTELNIDTTLDDWHQHTTADRMGETTYWAAVLSRHPIEPDADPHFATATSVVADVRFVSSVLPWRSAGERWPGRGLTEKMDSVLAALAPVVDRHTVWGGDWNQSLHGREYVGTTAGRASILSFCADRSLDVPTALLASATPSMRSIDHLAIPNTWRLDGVRRIVARSGTRRLSDHDAYVVDTSPEPC